MTAEDAVAAIRLCQDTAPFNQELLTAITAARSGTSEPVAVAAAFRSAQDGYEALADRVPAAYPRLEAAFREFADTLSRARLTGDVGVSGIADATEMVNAVCRAPA